MLKRLRKRFTRNRPDFLGRLIQQAEHTVNGMNLLVTYLSDHNPETAQSLRRSEKAADEERRLLIDELNRTFVTPIDREDIFALSRAIDDVLDYAYSTVNELEILEVESNPYLIRMASLLRDAAEEIRLAMHRLEDHASVANDHAVRAKALENRMEQVYREAIAELFKGPRDIDHIMEMLKLREIYRHMSNAADRGDEAANIITDIVVKSI
jgi:uncharacterized protein Yka (UPF0111/DUF47 family)